MGAPTLYDGGSLRFLFSATHPPVRPLPLFLSLIFPSSFSSPWGLEDEISLSFTPSVFLRVLRETQGHTACSPLWAWPSLWPCGSWSLPSPPESPCLVPGPEDRAGPYLMELRPVNRGGVRVYVSRVQHSHTHPCVLNFLVTGNSPL